MAAGASPSMAGRGTPPVAVSASRISSSTSTTGLPGGNSPRCASVATISFGSASATMWAISRSRYRTLIGTSTTPDCTQARKRSMNSSRFGSCTASRSPGSSPRRAQHGRDPRGAVRDLAERQLPPTVRARHRPGRRPRRVRAGTGRTGRQGAWRDCSRRSGSPSFRRPFSKPEQLSLVVPSVHHMERSPLCRSQRAQNRVVEQLDVTPEAGFTPRDRRVHRRKLCPNLASHLLHRQPLRLHDAGASRPAGMSAQPHDPERQHALRTWMASSRAMRRGSAPSPILWSFRCRSGTGVPAPPPRTTFPGDASSIARWTFLRRPTPAIASICPAADPWRYRPGLECHVLRVNRTAPR